MAISVENPRWQRPNYDPAAVEEACSTLLAYTMSVEYRRRGFGPALWRSIERSLEHSNELLDARWLVLPAACDNKDAQTVLGPYVLYLRKFGPQANAYRADDPGGAGPARDSVWTRIWAARQSLGATAVYEALESSSTPTDFWAIVGRGPAVRPVSGSAPRGIFDTAQAFVRECQREGLDPVTTLTRYIQDTGR